MMDREKKSGTRAPLQSLRLRENQALAIRDPKSRSHNNKANTDRSIYYETLLDFSQHTNSQAADDGQLHTDTPEVNEMDADETIDLPILKAPPVSEHNTNEQETTKNGIKVTFNPRAAEFQTRRRMSVPEQALLVPKSILKKRSSVCFGIEPVNRRVGFNPGSPTKGEDSEETGTVRASIFNSTGVNYQQAGWSCRGTRRKSELCLPSSDEFIRALFEMKTEIISDPCQ